MAGEAYLFMGNRRWKHAERKSGALHRLDERPYL